MAEARVYEGIHYRTSTEVGATMERRIGELAAMKVLGRSVAAHKTPMRTAHDSALGDYVTAAAGEPDPGTATYPH